MEDVLSDIFVILSDLYPDLSALISGCPDIGGIEGRVEDKQQPEIGWKVQNKNQKIVLTGNKQTDEIITRSRHVHEKGLRHSVIAKPGRDPRYHGHENGGTAVLKRKGQKLESANGLIKPMPPTELLPRGRNDPIVIMEQYENNQKKRSLRIVINTINPLSDIMSTLRIFAYVYLLTDSLLLLLSHYPNTESTCGKTSIKVQTRLMELEL